MPWSKVYSGVYKIQSISHPERCYIGSAVHIKSRWSVHKCELNKHTHGNPKLQRHFNKYGDCDLQYSILAICNKNELMPDKGVIWLEQCFIDAYKPFFNINKIAGSRMGAIISDETRNKLRQANLGKKQSEETKLKRSRLLKGIKRSDETRKRMSKAQEGNKKGLGKTPWNKGIKTGPMSEEECKRRSERTKGDKNPNWGKVPWNKGKKGSQVAWNKGKKGPKQSRETIEKRVASIKRTLALKKQNKLLE